MNKLLLNFFIRMFLYLNLILFSYFLLTTLYIYFKKRRKIKLITCIKEHRYIKIVDFAKWVLIDILRGKDRFKLFGIWAFTGYYGQGKTLGMVTFAKGLQRKHEHMNIKIYTNFNMVGQDGRIEKWEDLLNLPKNTIVLFDEIQSTFTSAKFKDFPIELLWKITQCRKQGLAIFCTTPVFTRMTIQLRESTDFVITSKNLFGLDRWFNYSFYYANEYERHMDNPVKLLTHRYLHYSFVTSDEDYNSYNTHEIVDRLDVVGEDKPVKGLTVTKVREIVIKEIDQILKKKAV